MNLLQLELRKLLPYKAFWVILALYTALLLIIFGSGRNITINGSTMGAQLYNLPAVWQNVTYLASYFNLLLGILIIVLVTDEYSFRTIRQQVIDGLSRMQLVLAKAHVILMLAVICTLLVGATGLFFGMSLGEKTTGSTLDKTSYLAGYFVQAVAYMSLALLVAILVKRSGIAIIAFLLYGNVVEPLIRSRVSDNIDKFFPMKSLSALTPMPGGEFLSQATGISNETLSIETALVLGIFYAVLFLGLSYLALKLRDL